MKLLQSALFSRTVCNDALTGSVAAGGGRPRSYCFILSFVEQVFYSFETGRLVSHCLAHSGDQMMPVPPDTAGLPSCCSVRR